MDNTIKFLAGIILFLLVFTYDLVKQGKNRTKKSFSK